MGGSLSAEMMKIIGEVKSSDFMVVQDKDEKEETVEAVVESKPSKASLKKAEIGKNLASDISKFLNKEEVDEEAFFGDATENNSQNPEKIESDEESDSKSNPDSEEVPSPEE